MRVSGRTAAMAVTVGLWEWAAAVEDAEDTRATMARGLGAGRAAARVGTEARAMETVAAMAAEAAGAAKAAAATAVVREEEVTAVARAVAMAADTGVVVVAACRAGQVGPVAGMVATVGTGMTGAAATEEVAVEVPAVVALETAIRWEAAVEAVKEVATESTEVATVATEATVAVAAVATEATATEEVVAATDPQWRPMGLWRYPETGTGALRAIVQDRPRRGALPKGTASRRVLAETGGTYGMTHVHVPPHWGDLQQREREVVLAGGEALGALLDTLARDTANQRAKQADEDGLDGGAEEEGEATSLQEADAQALVDRLVDIERTKTPPVDGGVSALTAELEAEADVLLEALLAVTQGVDGRALPLWVGGKRLKVHRDGHDLICRPGIASSHHRTWRCQLLKCNSLTVVAQPSGEHSTRASPSVFAQASAESYPQAMQAMTTCAPLRRHEVNWLVLIALLLVYIVPRTHDAVDGPRLLTPDERRLPNILKVMSPSSGFVEWGAAIGALGQCGTAPHVLSPQRVLLQTAGGALLPTLAYGFERGGLLRTCFRDAMHFGNNSWEFDGLLEWVMLLFAAIDFGYCVASYWGACHHFWRAVSVVGSPLYLVEDASRLRTLDARELPTLRRLDDGVVAVVAVLDSTAEVHLNKFFSHVRQISHPYHEAGLPLPRDTVDTLCAQAARDLLCLECATTTMDMVVVVVDAKLRRPLAEWCTTSLSFDSTGRVAVKAVEPRLLGSTEECLAVALQAAALLEVLEFAPCPQLTRGQALVRHHLYGPHLCDTIRMHHELETECMTPDERQADARRAPVVPTVLHMFDERVRVRHGLDLGCHFSSGEPSVATLSSSHVPLRVDVHTGAVDELDELRARGRRPLPHPLLCDSRRNRSLWYRQHRRSGGTHVGHQTAQEPGGALQGPRQASERGRVPGGRRGPLDDHAAEDHHLRGDGAPARPTVGHLASHLLGDAV